MPTRNVVVTPHQAEMIERLVEEGRYQNASEVLREGLRLLEVRDAAYQAKLAALRDAAKIGWDEIEAGRYMDFDTDEDLRDHFQTLTKRALDAGRG